MLRGAIDSNSTGLRQVLSSDGPRIVFADRATELQRGAGG